MDEAACAVVLAPGRDRPVRGRHPWVFSGSVARLRGSPEDGDVVDVLAHDGGFVARGLYNGRSQIRVRCYAWDAAQALDDAFWAGLLDAAVALRRGLGLLDPEGGCRLVFSEGDGLSGLVVDRYRDHLAVQLTSLALARRSDVLLDHLETLLAPASITLRTEKGILEEEGLELSDGLLRGREPDGPLTLVENGLRYRVDVRTGQKTGFYLDQRENRVRAAAFAPGRRAADVCCYTGGFTLPLLRAGAASVVGVDVSSAALALARDNLAENGLDDERAELVEANAFAWLEDQAEAGERYGLVVLDPPRFARSTRGVAQALRGYRRLNELALRCLDPGGVLVTCSCTGRVSRDDFVGVLGQVEEATGRRLRILDSRGQGGDHPVSPTCPETAYLKCLVCAVE